MKNKHRSPRPTAGRMVALGHAFHETAQGMRFTLSEVARREVLGRLLALNHSRYEVKAGLHAKKGGGETEEQMSLF